MDFSVGIAVLVLVTVLVVAVIGYGIYLNRRHDQWENVVGNAATDPQSGGLGVGNFSAAQRTPHKRKTTKNRSSRTPSSRTTNKKAIRRQQSGKVAPTVNTTLGNSAQSQNHEDTPELPHMSIEEVYKGGISTSGVPMVEGIVKHEIKGKRSDVFGGDLAERHSIETKQDAQSVNSATTVFDEHTESPTTDRVTPESPMPPLVEGIIGEVVKKPRDAAHSTISSGHRWTKENNAHVLKSDQAKNTRITTKSPATERVVPLRKGSTKILSNGASKARQNSSSSNADSSRLEEYVILRVSGKHANAFPLRELARFMLNRSLKFDDTGLFSMHDEDTNELMFKVADVYSPGQFDRAQIETYCTEGLTFIMCLAPLSNPQQSFEQMLSLASECARCFDAIVQDEHSNKLSNQTITHYRYRVADFRRKQMSM